MFLNRYCIIAVVILFVLTTGFIKNSSETVILMDDNPAGVFVDKKIKGVCWVGGDSIAEHNFKGLIEVGAEWISQTPFVWQGKYNEPSIELSSRHVLWGESDRGVIHTTKMAKEKGLKTILKPHIWVRRSEGKWRSDIGMVSKEDWDQWFMNYENIILHYAKLAEYADIEVLCIGTELLMPSTKFPDRWRQIIAKVKNEYSGKLTYAANFYKEFDSVKFWDDLDYIGVQAYFPLSEKHNPTEKQLIKAWRKHKRKLKAVSREYNKPVIFTEIGYKNTSNSAHEPWTWPQQLNPGEVQYSESTQAKCYQAMFKSFWEEPWFAGVFIWKWFHGGYKYTVEERNKFRAQRMDSLVRVGRFKPRSKATFSPQGKLAESVLKSWYSEQ